MAEDREVGPVGLEPGQTAAAGAEPQTTLVILEDLEHARRRKGVTAFFRAAIAGREIACQPHHPILCPDPQSAVASAQDRLCPQRRRGGERMGWVGLAKDATAEVTVQSRAGPDPERAILLLPNPEHQIGAETRGVVAPVAQDLETTAIRIAQAGQSAGGRGEQSALRPGLELDDDVGGQTEGILRIVAKAGETSLLRMEADQTLLPSAEPDAACAIIEDAPDVVLGCPVAARREVLQAEVFRIEAGDAAILESHPQRPVAGDGERLHLIAGDRALTPTRSPDLKAQSVEAGEPVGGADPKETLVIARDGIDGCGRQALLDPEALEERLSGRQGERRSAAEAAHPGEDRTQPLHRPLPLSYAAQQALS